jgi:hypothetical protein
MNRLDSKTVSFDLNGETFRLRPLHALLRITAAEVRTRISSLPEAEQFKVFSSDFIAPALSWAILDHGGNSAYEPEQILLNFLGPEIDALITKVLEISGMSELPDVRLKNSDPSPSGLQQSASASPAVAGTMSAS